MAALARRLISFLAFNIKNNVTVPRQQQNRQSSYVPSIFIENMLLLIF
jgi:hypothetical protein